MFCAEDSGEGGSGEDEEGEVITKPLYFFALILSFKIMTSIRTKPRVLEKVKMFIEIAKLRVKLKSESKFYLLKLSVNSNFQIL